MFILWVCRIPTHERKGARGALWRVMVLLFAKVFLGTVPTRVFAHIESCRGLQ